MTVWCLGVAWRRSVDCLQEAVKTRKRVSSAQDATQYVCMAHLGAALRAQVSVASWDDFCIRMIAAVIML